MPEEQIYDRAWIVSNSREVIAEYEEGITLRQLYYRLVAKGMTNNVKHYKKVVAAMTKARWDGIVNMTSFVDRERSMHGTTEADEKDLETEIETAKTMIDVYMKSHHLERWSNQDNFVEVWIEKKALQGVFEGPCEEMSVALAPCKGYPSLTFLNEARSRFQAAESNGKNVVILYFGDYDPSGEDIPRSIEDNLARMGCGVEVVRVALNAEIISELCLPGVPPKDTDSRTANWSGSEAVELDAVEPRKLQAMVEDELNKLFDPDKHDELREKEADERIEYRKQLKEFVSGLGDDMNDKGDDDE